MLRFDSISLNPIADVTNRFSRPYDLEGIGVTHRLKSNGIHHLFTKVTDY